MQAPTLPLSGLEKIPGLQGSDNVGLPILCVGWPFGGNVEILRAPFLADLSATTDADPGAANVRWNNVVPDSATELFIDDVDANAVNIVAALQSVGIGGYLYLQASLDATRQAVFQKWQVASLTDAAGYTKVGGTLVESNGAFIDGEQIELTVQQAGALTDAEGVPYDNSTSGLTATNVQDALDELAAGAGGGSSIGVRYDADTGSTADSDPGAGLLKWNHATQSSASVLFLDDTTTDGVSLTGWWSALDAGGFAYLQHATDPDIWQIWETATVTDAAGYVKLAVALLAYGGAFADGDPMLVTLQQGAGAGAVASVNGQTGVVVGVTAGKHAIPIMAGAMTPSVSGGCAVLATIASATNQPDIQTLDFDPSTAEYAQFAIPMPKSWNEGTVTFVPIWSHGATTVNFGVLWQLQGVAVSNDDTIAVNFGTVQSSADTGGTTNDVYQGPESSAITIAGAPSAEDVVFFRISRLPTDAADTMAIDARLHGIVLFINTNSDTDA